MEIGKPIMSQARQFAAEVKATVSYQMLAYNQIPSLCSSRGAEVPSRLCQADA